MDIVHNFRTEVLHTFVLNAVLGFDFVDNLDIPYYLWFVHNFDRIARNFLLCNFDFPIVLVQ